MYEHKDMLEKEFFEIVRNAISNIMSTAAKQTRIIIIVLFVRLLFVLIPLYFVGNIDV